ncbi:alpha-glucosidase C-terminal domain-containing protein [Sporolactobacillus sp. STCC-11]|uniref:alpha-amylase family glycosyl hydrolase n=1 Tax=Sporolactobacillus caesalpiniae TaxID=3230362 RepID=UPI00339AD540
MQNLGRHFTSDGEPWLTINPNYQKINVAETVQRKDSVFYYYQKLIELCQKYDIITNGEYQLDAQEDEQIFAFRRVGQKETLLVVTNFSDHEKTYRLSEDLKHYSGKLLINNYDRKTDLHDELQIKPYEAIVYLLS